MFKQFTENIQGNQGYLLFSLGIFLVFFIVVTVLLIKLKKSFADEMSAMPLKDGETDTLNTLLP